MNMKKTNASEDGSYLFQVEILLRAPSNGEALERLLHHLNEGSFADYRIQSGVQLGKQIEQELSEATSVAPVLTDALDSRIRGYIQSNKLIRININKGKGVKLSWPCRVVNFDPNLELLTLYHVDEKKVYSIKLNEIDDFLE